ncbi:hypothetical protein vBSscSF1_49 [Staphylococcus phage vB-SscS-F1]|nr:hypothetical protein vBApySJF1_49 [Arcanobacterium phage vB-ApyS-JF1]
MTNFKNIYNEYKPQIEKLNRQFKKLQKHTKDLGYTDLKLHDVSFYVGNDEKLLKHFENFCECEYDYFNDWLEENMLETEYIGRTSSFYFYGGYAESNFYDFDIYDMKDDQNIFDTLGYGLESEIELLLDSSNLKEFYYDLENNLNYDLSDSDELDDLEIELENSIEELQEYLIAYYKEIKAVKRAYKWLEDYKANQVDYFKDYVENNEF